MTTTMGLSYQIALDDHKASDKRDHEKRINLLQILLLSDISMSECALRLM